MKKINDIFNSAKHCVKQHSPEILIVSGVVGVVASTVLACRATLKVSEVLEESKELIDTIHEVKETKPEKYSADDAKKDLTVIYLRTALKVAKLYAPAVILGSLSITSIFASNNILRKRNIALAAAYSAVDKGFKEYRKRVVDKFGEEVDKELKYGLKDKTIEEETVDEDGKVKKTKKKTKVKDLSELSEYAVYFDKDTSYCCEDDRNYNLMFLRGQENYANDLLRVRGYITLKEVLEMLGMEYAANSELRKASLVVGWKYEKDNPEGDNHVSFNVTETYRETEDGKTEPCIILDFNVDGCIYDRM